MTMSKGIVLVLIILALWFFITRNKRKTQAV